MGAPLVPEAVAERVWDAAVAAGRPPPLAPLQRRVGAGVAAPPPLPPPLTMTLALEQRCRSGGDRGCRLCAAASPFPDRAWEGRWLSPRARWGRGGRGRCGWYHPRPRRQTAAGWRKGGWRRGLAHGDGRGKGKGREQGDSAGRDLKGANPSSLGGGGTMGGLAPAIIRCTERCAGVGQPRPASTTGIPVPVVTLKA